VQAGVEVISHAPDLASTVISPFENWRRKDLPVTAEVKKASFDPANYQALLAQMKQHDTMLDATLTIFHQLQNRNLNAATIYQHGVLLTKLAHQQGIKIVAGTDYLTDKAGLDYPMVHQEMQLLVEQTGLTPLEAIQAATLHGAEAIGIADKVGSIEAGKKANLLILSANPADNISNSRQISHVIKNGQFVYRGDDSRLPFSSARVVNGILYLSGQLGNFPGTMSLNGTSIESQMHQTMRNIGAVLQQHKLDFAAVFKCTVMLEDIKDWPAANKVYIQYFKAPLPARSAFATNGLALGAKAEVECMAQL
jgi:reactive intermediate/imine deaminase